MSDKNAGNAGEIVTPHKHTLIIAPDRANVGIVFDSHNRERLTIVLPLLAAAALRRSLGEILDTLGVAADGTIRTPGRPN